MVKKEHFMIRRISPFLCMFWLQREGMSGTRSPDGRCPPPNAAVGCTLHVGKESNSPQLRCLVNDDMHHSTRHNGERMTRGNLQTPPTSRFTAYERAISNTCSLSIVFLKSCLSHSPHIETLHPPPATPQDQPILTLTGSHH